MLLGHRVSNLIKMFVRPARAPKGGNYAQHKTALDYKFIYFCGTTAAAAEAAIRLMLLDK